ncbi:MAG: penicillin acylase family protein [Bacteroidetes bacterium]|nr:penicillin acylase family protein [Bacteroidota bacterium]
MEATWKLAHSESMVEFREAVSMIAAPGLNIAYADAQNNIAWYTAAKFAIRPVDVDASLLQDGTGANDWQGYYDFDKIQDRKILSWDFVLSANNDPQIDTTNIFPAIMSLMIVMCAYAICCLQKVNSIATILKE